MPTHRKRPVVAITLSPEELLDLDHIADTRGLTRSRMIATLVREEARREERRGR